MQLSCAMLWGDAAIDTVRFLERARSMWAVGAVGASLAISSLALASESIDAAQKPPVDIAILTIVPAEYWAMDRKLELTPLRDPDPRVVNRYAWATATVKSRVDARRHRVVVGLAGETGQLTATRMAQRAIERFSPSALLVVGIAGGVSGQVELFDVVVSDGIWGYEHGRVDGQFRPDLSQYYRTDRTLLAAAAQVTTGWQGIGVPPPICTSVAVAPTVHFGQTASGDKVIEQRFTQVYRRIRGIHGGFNSIEMEGAGVARVVAEANESGRSVRFAMIRGISDIPGWRGGDKNREGRKNCRWYAAERAAGFARELIESHWPDFARPESDG